MSEEELRQYCKDASNEIIKLAEENTQLKKEKDDFIKAIIELQYEIVDLKSVLKEIREYITGNYDFYYGDELYDQYKDILEIIDKALKGGDE